MNTRLLSSLAIAAISATTAVANAGYDPLTRSHASKDVSGESMQRPRLPRGSGAGPIAGSAPVGVVAASDCYTAGAALPGTAANFPGAAPAPGIAPRAGEKGGRNDFAASLVGSSHSSGRHSGPSGAAPTDSDHFADAMSNPAGSKGGTFDRGAKWKKTALGTYPLGEFATPPSTPLPCTTPPGATAPGSAPSDTEIDTDTDAGTDTPAGTGTEPNTDTEPFDPALPGSELPGSHPPGGNPPDSPPLDPYLLELPPLDLVSLDPAESETTFREPASLLQVAPNAVPEPGSLVLLAIGLGAWAGVRRRRTVD